MHYLLPPFPLKSSQVHPDSKGSQPSLETQPHSSSPIAWRLFLCFTRFSLGKTWTRVQAFVTTIFGMPSGTIQYIQKSISFLVSKRRLHFHVEEIVLLLEYQTFKRFNSKDLVTLISHNSYHFLFPLRMTISRPPLLHGKFLASLTSITLLLSQNILPLSQVLPRKNLVKHGNNLQAMGLEL